MSLKAGLSPIETMTELSADQRRALRLLSVTSIEEFVGMARSAPADLGRVLSVDDCELEELVERAEKRLSPEVVDALRAPIQNYPLGALDPRARRG